MRGSALADDALWALLKGGGQVVMIRHAAAPGTGDPPGFRIDDCSAQRNLSEAGREEARQIGAVFRARGIPVGRVLSSRWCRCLETARLAFGRAEPWPALESLFRDPNLEEARTREVRQLVSRPFMGANLILVTHNFNIRALTGISPASGEMVVITPGGDRRFRVAGRLAPRALR
ncbi:MAG: histidine phosphatase family protein [Candidatus Rokubacteria bacterium]|nr:histidine phosphatase family protein [Candidatus Rokubacteria bacterium]